ncbi:MAG: hypothetical protein Ta2G_03200 [Termitinemataceae bacterium]|nr:MAG: hypothetical protein Ta2G_03200 [Termitinemataceae bacterium]
MYNMGSVYTEITLKNAIDNGLVQRGSLKKEDVRQTTFTALVDTGAYTLVINEKIFAELGLKAVGTRRVNLADGGSVDCKETEPVEICWKNRSCTFSAWVLQNADEMLLGVIPLLYMDLIVNPLKQELVGAHGDLVLGKIK